MAAKVSPAFFLFDPNLAFAHAAEPVGAGVFALLPDGSECREQIAESGGFGGRALDRRRAAGRRAKPRSNKTGLPFVSTTAAITRADDCSVR